MTRAGTLASAAERLDVDASTVFRSLQRIERGLGQSLFERGRTGYIANETALALAEQGERVEAAVESSRSLTQSQPDQVSGVVRITSTDSVLHGLIAPALLSLNAAHPLLELECQTGNELASLTRRDADIAVRATQRPPQHLVGKHIGPLRAALFAAKSGTTLAYEDVMAGRAAWIAVDDVLPEHPSVIWRRRHFPKANAQYRVDSVLTVLEFVALGLGVGILPIFLAQGREDLAQITEVIDECQTELWLLTHTESRHLRRVSTAYAHLAQHLALP